MTTSAKTENQAQDDGNEDFELREVVGVFPDETAFLAAVDDLLERGFDRADLSVLGHGRNAKVGFDRLARGAASLADDGNIPRAALVTPEAISQAKAAAIGLPLYAGTLGGLLAVVATGGTLAFAIPVAVAGGLAGSGLGAIGARVVGRAHRRDIEDQVAAGGILLWARTDTPEREERAQRLMKRAGGKSVHVHQATIRWGVDNVPFAHVEPDPLLERGPDYD